MLLQPILSSDDEGIKWVKLQSWLRLAVDNAGISYSMAYPLTDILSSDMEGVKWAKLGAWMQLLAENISGGGGGGGITTLTGDVTAGPGSGSQAATIPNGTVTLAKMANLAQDQFIGRTTASTGVPQTATITAAARTVLDDVTVAAMVDTLGGASSTGTGGLARATSPTFVTPALGTIASGNLGAGTVDGTSVVGFRGIPVNSQSTAYSTVAADNGKQIVHPVGDNNARTFTIDDSAYAGATAITFVNFINVVTIALSSGTMTLFEGAGTGSTGNRSLAAGGVATATRIGAGSWVITGTGLT